jgi:hypothetical protein
MVMEVGQQYPEQKTIEAHMGKLLDLVPRSTHMTSARSEDQA